MKVSKEFKKQIETYLKDRAKTDALFAEKFNNPEKKIDDCITYILNEVRKTGYNAFADAEIYNMAVHYYDEEKIDIGKPVNGPVAVNHIDEASEEEPEEKSTAVAPVKTPAPAKKSKKVDENQTSLF